MAMAWIIWCCSIDGDGVSGMSTSLSVEAATLRALPSAHIWDRTEEGIAKCRSKMEISWNLEGFGANQCLAAALDIICKQYLDSLHPCIVYCVLDTLDCLAEWSWSANSQRMFVQDAQMPALEHQSAMFHWENPITMGIRLTGSQHSPNLSKGGLWLHSHDHITWCVSEALVLL